MTVTNKYISPIPAESTPGGFLRAARLLPDGADWTGGLTFTPSCGGAAVWGCAYGEAKTNINTKADPVEFDPFIVYAGMECGGAPDEAELRELAQINLRRGMSGSIAREIQQSDPKIGNPDLVSSAVDITPVAGAPSIRNAIAGLLTTSGDCGGGEITIHAPIVVLSALMTFDLVEFVDGRYRIGGHTVIVDNYENIGPTGSPAPADNEVYLYATGPVEYRLGENVDVATFTPRLNEQLVLAEQLAIVRFDPCCVYAIRAEIC